MKGRYPRHQHNIYCPFSESVTDIVSSFTRRNTRDWNWFYCSHNQNHYHSYEQDIPLTHWNDAAILKFSIEISCSKSKRFVLETIDIPSAPWHEAADIPTSTQIHWSARRLSDPLAAWEMKQTRLASFIAHAKTCIMFLWNSIDIEKKLANSKQHKGSRHFGQLYYR